MDYKERICKIIDDKKNIFTDMSDFIWENPELRFNLKKAADKLCLIFEEEGFKIKRNISKMEDAFIAEFGSGEPVIGILGEYDALSGLSQQNDIDYKSALNNNGAGHGCGHQSLGVAGLASAIAIKELIKENKIQGTIKYFGCPGEEGGAGKAYLARDGFFDGLDSIISWHPMDKTSVWNGSSLSNMHIFISFSGVSSHAAAAPEQGRSALDAAELTNIGTNYMREHIIDEARIHYSYLDAGGTSPNIVPANATLLYVVRAPKSNQTIELFNRVSNIAKGASLMTETEVKIECDSFYSEIIINETLAKAMYNNMEILGDITYTEDEAKYAENFFYSIPKQTRDNKKIEVFTKFKSKGMEEAERIANSFVNGKLFPFEISEKPLPLSTDVGDASFFAPTVQLIATCFPNYTALHTWQCVAVGKSSIMHKGMIYAAKAMAMTAFDIFNDSELLIKAKEEFKERTYLRPYFNPMPKENNPY